MFKLKIVPTNCRKQKCIECGKQQQITKHHTYAITKTKDSSNSANISCKKNSYKTIFNSFLQYGWTATFFKLTYVIFVLCPFQNHLKLDS